MIKTGIRSDHGPIRAALSSAILGAYPFCNTSPSFGISILAKLSSGEIKVRSRKRDPLLGVLLDTGLHLFDFLREHLPDNVDDIKDGVRYTYDTASRRVSRATDALRGNEESHVFRTIGVLLVGVGIGVGVGLLIAPATGEETRVDIADKVSDFGEKVRERTGKKPQGAPATPGE